jgi:NADH dehydrogenase/NADH:ubiquinone oxidoreductase subunit G
MIPLTIDNQEIEVEEGCTILEAARDNGIFIPTLCYHEALEPYAACRLCVVEIEGKRGSRLVASCAYPCEEGTVVHTNSEMVRSSRRMTVELLMASGEHLSLVRALADELGVSEPRFRLPPDDCVLCGLCVRACRDIVGVAAISLVNRGMEKKVGPPFEIASNACIECGTCVLICPTGALKLEDITKDEKTVHQWGSLFDQHPCRICGDHNLESHFSVNYRSLLGGQTSDEE